MADIREEVRRLREQGLSEADAIKKASKAKPRVEKTVEPVEEGDESLDDVEMGDRTFVVVTKDFSGLGWANKLQQEGETVVIATDYTSEKDPKLLAPLKLVGKGWIDIIQIDKAMAAHSSDDTYWIFAENCFPEFATKLKKAGQKIFPPSMELGEEMEHDRNMAVQLAEDVGLTPPVTHEFSSVDEGMSFLAENPDTAYVFKPDDSQFNYMTFVPVRKKDPDANRELFLYLQHMTKDPGSYILQERIPIEDALEVNVECWFHEGEPFLATLGLEVKRKQTYDIGEMTGCGGDVFQLIPLDSELVKQTVSLMFPFYKEKKYTGFGDVNVLFTKDGVPHFLEVCNRFGYNAHVTLLMGLATDTVGNILADFVDGNIEGMESRFHTDVGGSLTLFIDHPREGLPVHVDPAVEERFYPFDGMKDDGQLLLTAYSQEIGIIVDHAATPEAVAEKILDAVIHEEVISCPDLYYRMDLGGTDYYNAPVLRYKELKKRGLL